jgi:hypothetical protein
VTISATSERSHAKLGVQLTAHGAVLGRVYTALDGFVVYNMPELAIDDGQ